MAITNIILLLSTLAQLAETLLRLLAAGLAIIVWRKRLLRRLRERR